MSSNEKNFFANNLLQLQNHIKRDPTSYKDEVGFFYIINILILKEKKISKIFLISFYKHITIMSLSYKSI